MTPPSAPDLARPLPWLLAAGAAAAGFRLGRALDLSLLPHLAALAGRPSPARWLRAARSRGVGLLVSALFLACFLLKPAAPAACGCVLLLGLAGAAVIDAEHMIIPDLFTVGLAGAGLLLSPLCPALHGEGGLSLLHGLRAEADALLGLALGSALALWMGITAELVLGREALGFGDVKFLGAIGAFCGWRGAVFALFGGACLGLLACLGGAAGRRLSGRAAPVGGSAGALRMGVPFPFGPLLAAAAALYFLALGAPVDRYLQAYAAFF